MNSVIYLLSVGLLAATVTTSTAQELSTELVTTLKGEFDESSNIPLARDTRGRVYVNRFGIVEVYGSDGEYITTIGREGEGPNEYRRVGQALVLPGDTLWLIDYANGRIVVVDPEEYLEQRTMPIAFMVQGGAALPTGEAVLNCFWPDADRIGYALTTLSSEGTPRATFEEAAYWKGDWEQWHRHVTVTKDGTIWSLPMRYSNLAQAWTADGRSLGEITLGRSWLDDPTTPYSRPAPDSPPFDRIIHFGALGNDLLVSGVTPDSEWRDAFRGTIEIEGRSMYDYDHNDVYDGVLELISTDDGSSLTLRVDWVPWIVFSDGHVLTASRDELGLLEYVVYRVSKEQQ
jgi:hypothetical protein